MLLILFHLVDRQIDSIWSIILVSQIIIIIINYPVTAAVLLLTKKKKIRVYFDNYFRGIFGESL